MAEKLEAVARAIYEGRNGRGCVPWARQASAHKEPYLKDAEAALLAIFEIEHPISAALALSRKDETNG